jgi:hypothetical protein
MDILGGDSLPNAAIPYYRKEKKNQRNWKDRRNDMNTQPQKSGPIPPIFY